MNTNTMTYLGYVSTVEYSDEDGCFIGRVLGIDDIVSFEGASVKELRTDFENAVNSYVATCQELGKIPERQCSGKLLVRLPSELHHKLTVESGVRGESINNLVVRALQSAYLRRKTAKPSDSKKTRTGTRKERQRINRD